MDKVQIDGLAEQLRIRSDEKKGITYTMALSLFTHAGIAALFIALLIQRYFDDHHKLVCLMVIIYSRILSVIFFTQLETMRNSGKLDILLNNQSVESRKFEDGIFRDAAKVLNHSITIFFAVNMTLLVVAIWMLF